MFKEVTTNAKETTKTMATRNSHNTEIKIPSAASGNIKGSKGWLTIMNFAVRSQMTETISNIAN